MLYFCTVEIKNKVVFSFIELADIIIIRFSQWASSQLILSQSPKYNHSTYFESSIITNSSTLALFSVLCSICVHFNKFKIYISMFFLASIWFCIKHIGKYKKKLQKKERIGGN